MIYLLVRDQDTYESGHYVVPCKYYTDEAEAQKAAAYCNQKLKELQSALSKNSWSAYAVIKAKHVADLKEYDIQADDDSLDGYSVMTIENGPHFHSVTTKHGS